MVSLKVPFVPKVSDGSIFVATVLDCSSAIFSFESSSDLSLVKDFLLFESFARTYEALFFFKAIKTGRDSPYFPEPVATDFDILLFFRDEWLDFTTSANFSGPLICSICTERGDTSDGGSRLTLAIFGLFANDWVS